MSLDVTIKEQVLTSLRNLIGRLETNTLNQEETLALIASIFATDEQALDDSNHANILTPKGGWTLSRAAIAEWVGTSPELLDTIEEIAAALGNDPDAFNTLMNAITELRKDLTDFGISVPLDFETNKFWIEPDFGHFEDKLIGVYLGHAKDLDLEIPNSKFNPDIPVNVTILVSGYYLVGSVAPSGEESRRALVFTCTQGKYTYRAATDSADVSGIFNWQEIPNGDVITYNFNLPENEAFVSTDPAVFSTLADGIYKGHVRSGLIELTEQITDIGGVINDEEVIMEVTVYPHPHLANEKLVTREIKTALYTYNATLDNTPIVPGSQNTTEINRIIPMASANDHNQTVFASSLYSVAYPGWHAMVSTPADVGWCAANAKMPTVANPIYLLITFGDGPVKVNGFSVANRLATGGAQIGDFTLSGWNADTGSWDLLHTVVGRTDSGLGQETIYDVLDAGEYTSTKFKLNITGVITTSDFMALGMFRLFDRTVAVSHAGNWSRDAHIQDICEDSADIDFIYDLVAALDDVNVEERPGAPALGWDGSYDTSVAWHTGRNLNDSIGLYWTKDTGMWYICCGGYGDWQSQNVMLNVERYGLQVLASGKYAEPADAANIQWKVEVIEGAPNLRVVSETYGNTPYGTISVPAILDHSVNPGSHKFEAVLRVSTKDTVSGEETHRNLKLTRTVNNKYPIPFLGEGVRIANWPWLEYGVMQIKGNNPENLVTKSNGEAIGFIAVSRNVPGTNSGDANHLLYPQDGALKVHTGRAYPFEILVGVGMSNNIAADGKIAEHYLVTLEIAPEGETPKVFTLVHETEWNETEWSSDGTIANIVYFDSSQNYDDYTWQISTLNGHWNAFTPVLGNLFPGLTEISGADGGNSTFNTKITATLSFAPIGSTKGKAFTHSVVIDATLV